MKVDHNTLNIEKSEWASPPCRTVNPTWCCKCARLFLATALMVVMVAKAGHAQFAGYASVTNGFQSNVLSNYQQIPSRTTEGYLDIGYLLASRVRDFKAGYVGGLMLFNALPDRNYYEHHLDFKYAARFGGFLKLMPPDSEEADPEDIPEVFQGNVFDLAARLSARHDRPIYRAYDNAGVDLTGGFTWGAGKETDFRLSDQAGLRNYHYLPELNNVFNLMMGRLSGMLPGNVHAGMFVSAGLKHFTTAMIDTTRVTTAVGSFRVTNKGKGKGGAGFSGSNGGTHDDNARKVLENPETVDTYQLSAGITLTPQWVTGSLEAQALYRYNPKGAVRILTQYANATVLSEDIYNDYFSYGGPEGSFVLHQKLPLALDLTLQAEAGRRKYLAPALDLDGIETSGNRIDLRGSMEMVLSRSFLIADPWSLDVSFTMSAVRNQSNDTYNDFSYTLYSLGFGIGL